MLVHDLDRGRSVGVQVKTLSRRGKHYFPPNRGYPIVYVLLDSDFVLDRKTVDKIAEQMEKLPQNRRFVHRDLVEEPDTKEGWDNIWPAGLAILN